MTFPFNQPEKTKDCGYRCLYYVIDPKVPYKDWLEQFRFFQPVKSGIFFHDILCVLEYYKIADCKFTVPTETDTFIIYSGSWLKHGHYFVYDKGVIYDSTKSAPEKMPLHEVISRIEAKTVDGAFRCLRVRK